MGRQVAILHDKVVDNIAARFANPARMQAAIGTNVTRAQTAVYGAVGWGGILSSAPPYMTIQEVGGTTSPHDIVARNSSVLAFFSEDAAAGTMFARRVHHPGSRIPPHYFLRDAFRDRREAMIEAFRAVTGGAVRDRTT